MPHIAYYIMGMVFIAFLFEVLLRLFTGREITAQISGEIEKIKRTILGRLRPSHTKSTPKTSIKNTAGEKNEK